MVGLRERRGEQARLVRSLGVIVLMLTLADSTAWAGCGEYVVSTTRNQPLMPAPCQGPNCSQGDPTPLAPPVTTFSAQTDEWSFLGAWLDPASSAASLDCLMGDAQTTSNPFLTDIFHPPR